MMSDCRHHSSKEAFRPIGARRYRNRPCGMRNVVSLLDLSSSASWKYPCTASSLQNSLASGGIASMISRVEGKGCVGLRTYSLSPVKSVTRRTRRPSALGTKKAGLHHVVASSTGVMTPRSINCATVFFDSGSKCLGTLLAVVTHVGDALSSSAMDMGVHFMG